MSMQPLPHRDRVRLRPLTSRGEPAAVAALLGVMLWSGVALAQSKPAAPAEQQNPVPAQTGTALKGASDANDGDFFTGVWRRSNLLGDIGGLRTMLGNFGITLNLSETSEVFGNVTGGIHRGADYDGLTTMGVVLDTKQAFGWSGGTFNASAFQIHGRSLSADNLETLQTASGIEATRATRLWEIWYQQALLDGKVDVKIGQQSLDQEFYGSAGSSLFINTMMGWPLIPSVDLYAGGPAYPLSSLGVRLRAQPFSNVTMLAGVFDDNPPGGPFFADSQVLGAEKSGTRFNLNTGALFFGEVQYAINQPATGDMAYDAGGSGLPGVYKLGAWYDTARFPDYRFDNTGLLLADPNSSGQNAYHRGNYSIYGVMDQMIWRPDPDGPQSLNIFARIMGSPSDRNLVDFSVNGGVTLKAPLAGRDNDTAGVGFGVGHVGRNVSGFDKDVAAAAGLTGPKRSSETFIELTYQYQIAPWWQVQPDFQYVFLPGGGITNPNDPASRINNEAVFGIRTNVTF